LQLMQTRLVYAVEVEVYMYMRFTIVAYVPESTSPHGSILGSSYRTVFPRPFQGPPVTQGALSLVPSHLSGTPFSDSDTSCFSIAYSSPFSRAFDYGRLECNYWETGCHIRWTQ
jgi:hypothetical protein